MQKKNDFFAFIMQVYYHGGSISVWCVVLLCMLTLAQFSNSNDDSTQHPSEAPAAADDTDSGAGNENIRQTDQSNENATSNSNAAVHLYRRLFRQKRMDHMDAVKRIMSLGTTGEKQKKILEAIFGKLFVVFKEAKVRLMEVSFTPGDPFPTDDQIKNVFSMVVENTAFLGDFVLRMPDICHALLDSNADWKALTMWAVTFTTDTGVLVDADAKQLNLLAQELGIIEKDPSYVNPFKRETVVSKVVDQEVERIIAERKRAELKKQKKEQKKKLKGPRMSSHRNTEL